MSLNVTSQANLLLDKFLAQAVGTLYRELGFVQETTRWATDQRIENGGTFNIPLLGSFSSNTRAPGGSVIDQTPSPTRRTISISEEEVSFVIDPTWAASEGSVMFLAQEIENATNTLLQAVTGSILETVATTGGLATVGTLGVANVKADWDTASKTLDDNSIPVGPRLAVISTDQKVDLTNIPEFADYDKAGIAGTHASGAVGRANGFDIISSPYVYSPAGGQHIGFATWARSIWTVFPMQETFNKGDVAVKTVAEVDGLRLYMLREYVEAQNGAERITMSIRFGSRVGRDDGVVLINGQ